MALVQKAFSDIITFSRSSNATRVGPTGLVEYAPHNLLVRSQEFDNASWTKAAGATVTANSAAAPDGTITADLVATDFVYQGSLTYSVATLSVYVKAGTSTDSFVYMDNSGAKFCRFNVTTGVITATASGYSSSITSIGNGWYRITFTGQISGACGFGQNGSGNGYFWGAQLAVGPYALDYTPTTSAAVYGPRFDYNGSGVTIVEPVSRNLLTYSEDLTNGVWNKFNTTVSANTTISPDGQTTADTLTEDTSTGQHFISQQTSKTNANIQYTFSAYVKRGTSGTRNVALAITDGATGGYEAVFDPDDGAILIAARGIAVTTGWIAGAATATNAGNGWWRFSFSVSSNTSIRLDGVVYMNDGTNNSYTGNGSSNLFVWGAQLEVGSTATGYMVSGATNGFRAVPVVSGSATARGLLVEEQRTNLALYSEDFSNAAWAKTRSSITANAIAAPDGTVTADKLVEDTTASNTHFIVQSIAMGGSVDSSRFAFGIFAKAGERSRFRMFDNNQSSSGDSTFDLSAGTVVTGSGTITNVGNGWYRCTIYPLKDFSTTSTVRIFIDNGSTTSYTGDGTSGLYLWGAQLEAGSFATSYIPTLASTVTRSADVASVNTLSPFYNAVEGTIYAEWSMVGSSVGTGYPAIAQFDDTTATNYIAIRQDGTGDSRRYGIVATSSTTAAMLAGTAESLSANTVLKSALAYKANDFAFVRGSTLGTSSSGAIPAVTNLKLGRNEAGTYTNAHVRRIAYYPVRLSAAQLQALTA